MEVLTGKTDLNPSDNDWDWLADGIYFWEQDPKRALDYAVEVAGGSQFNKKRIKTPFVLGSIIELGNCLNLVESQSLAILEEAYKGLFELYSRIGRKMPVNRGANRQLDCAVIKYVHLSRLKENLDPFDTVRSAFDEGDKVYENATFSSRHHIQVCVRDSSKIKGYFLPRPISEFNPYLLTDFINDK